eukprot:3444670-Alexandrium_andersonii.AAC.1
MPPGPPREAPPARPPARFVGGFGICARNDTGSTRPEPQGQISRPLLGPRSSRFERSERSLYGQLTLALLGSV